DYERKTVEVGPWLEECIPRHTILYTSIILAWEGRLSLSIPLKRKDELKDLIDRLLGGGPVEISMKCDLEKGACRLSLSPDHVLRLLLPERGALFLGGNVTVGRGLLEVGAI
ncbi:MAG: hypothetical protein N3H31_06510, partial [Candidatus Nezhaarchaeota archaeon]|nr:hypothetical protein [Candidatus Nezhaarchaeota archaeon]